MLRSRILRWVRSAEELNQVVRFPVFVKRPIGIASSGVRRASALRELELAADALGLGENEPQAFCWTSAAKACHELPHRGADLVWRILLDKVDALNGDFPLVRPTAAEVANTSDDLGTRIGIDEELWKIAPGEPFAIAFDDLDYVGRSALYRQLARPYKRWEARLPIQKRRTVSRHFLVAQLPNDAFR